ncbi:hypothetical protein Tco_1457240 [Tanacetum coccineum]
MITDEMKLTDHYRMYVAVFEVDVPMTQSQPIESTQGTHRTTSAPRGQDDPHDDAHHERENSAKRQKTSEYRTFVFGESSSGQDYRSEPGPSTLRNQEQLDDFDFWADSYAINDDEIPTEKVSQELVDEMSHTVDEAKLRKVVDEMLRQRCTSGDEHQYHID